MSTQAVILKEGREKSLMRRHPWIFSGAVARTEGSPEPGTTVAIRAANNTLLGWGSYSPASQILVRVWSFNPKEELCAGLIQQRVAGAVAERRALFGDPLPDGVRLINSESDGLPGVVVDRYGDYLVCQLTSTGAVFWKKTLVAALNATFPNAGIFERSDVESCAKEGIGQNIGVLSGQEPPEEITIQEGQGRFLVSVREGHKTGFYLDQRENRLFSAGFMAGAEVLNAFCYTGAFGIHALLAGARQVTQIDSSKPTLAIAQRHLELNGCAPEQMESIAGNAFEVMRRFRDSRRSFDCIILDPPRLAESASQVDRASRAYKDANLLACKLLRPGGILMTYSCSGNISAELFQMIVAGAALDSGREVVMLHHQGQAADHPVALTFPEGTYLKGLVCRVR